MGPRPRRELTSRNFTRGSFQYVVLGLREACLDGAATIQEVETWRKLADWLDCADRPFTSDDDEHLTYARIAFLRAAAGAEYDTSKLPPPEICDIFERLAPAVPAIEKLKSGQQATGIGRVWGSVAAGAVILGYILVSFIGRRFVPYEIASAAVPIVLGVVACAVWRRGGAEFRPWKDGLIVAAVALTVQCLAILLRMANQRGTTQEDMWVVVVASLVFLVIGWLSIALVTWLLNRLAAVSKAAAA